MANFYDTENSLINAILLLHNAPFYKVDCLRMAVVANCEEFISHPSIQKLLTDIWYGKMTQKSGIKEYFYVN